MGEAHPSVGLGGHQNELRVRSTLSRDKHLVHLDERAERLPIWGGPSRRAACATNSTPPCRLIHWRSLAEMPGDLNTALNHILSGFFVVSSSVRRSGSPARPQSAQSNRKPLRSLYTRVLLQRAQAGLPPQRASSFARSQIAPRILSPSRERLSQVRCVMAQLLVGTPGALDCETLGIGAWCRPLPSCCGLASNSENHTSSRVSPSQVV